MQQAQFDTDFVIKANVALIDTVSELLMVVINTSGQFVDATLKIVDDCGKIFEQQCQHVNKVTFQILNKEYLNS